jgi:gamma-glutamyl:cysteine ligase YbdK (ATP-grasp superfamily)
VPLHFGSKRVKSGAAGEDDLAAVCTSVCTPPAEASLEAAIERLTLALATADDETIAELVAERRAMREQLRAMKADSAGVVDLGVRRARRTPTP